MTINQNELAKEFGKNLILNEKLSKYSWFNLGGPAEIFFRPENKEQLKKFIKKIKNYSKINFIGAGSNILFRDGGYKGIIIKLGSKFSSMELIEKNIIDVGAAALDKTLSSFALNNSLGGFEYLSCIPGSIGGAIMMNSGCYDNEISKNLISINVIDLEGNEKEIKKENIKFFYRGNNLSKELLIISAKFKGMPTSKDEIQNTVNAYIEQKKLSQPSKIKTCGSTFKNPPNMKAWELIKKSGCENLSFGKASISKKHNNFFINEGGATSADIEKLITLVQKKVFEKFKVNLDLELKLIGDSLNE